MNQKQNQGRPVDRARQFAEQLNEQIELVDQWQIESENKGQLKKNQVFGKLKADLISAKLRYQKVISNYERKQQRQEQSNGHDEPAYQQESQQPQSNRQSRRQPSMA